MVLEAIDHVVLGDPDAGETSALVMLVQQGVVVGASVGDSLAYVVSPVGEAQLLTTRQHREPSIGTGLSRPIGFGPAQLDGKLITRRATRFDPLFVGQTTLQSVYQSGWTERASFRTTNDPPIGT
jgi:hypothetical protein